MCGRWWSPRSSPWAIASSKPTAATRHWPSCEERPDGFDLLISDMVMPGEIDGLGLAKTARQRWPKLAILLTTGFSDVIVDEAGDGKAVDFGVLRKPYRKADLARAMRAALAVAGA